MAGPSADWLPPLSDKGMQLFNDPHRYVLAWGPRKTGKTIAVLHTLVRHAYWSPSTTVAIVAKTLKVGRIGPWSDLIRYILPIWTSAEIGFRISKEESFMADTKMCYIRTRGPCGECQIELHSCEHPDEAESRFKSGRWSFIYISEADTFPDAKPFKVLSDQLRNPLMPFEHQHVIMDANPAEEGEDHWLYKTFFGADGVDHPRREYAKLFHQIRFDFVDNKWLQTAEREELEAKYSSDPVDNARFVQGLWLADRSSYLFGEVFRPNTHVIGELKGADTEALVPSSMCTELYTGWDLGDRNHACVIFGRKITASTKSLSVFDVIDEVVSINRDTSLADFVVQVLDKMVQWETLLMGMYGHEGVRWRHYSDSSASRFRAGIGDNEESEVRKLSDGRVNLQMAAKGPGSVRDRVVLLRKLLFESRIFFSATCVHVIDSLSKLREGTNTEYIRFSDRRKHAFDALTYGLSRESPIIARPGHVTAKRKLQPIFTST